jgi:intracellular sulfur oxidation DsrE/DsrF family protein
LEGGFFGSFIDFSSTSALTEDTTTRFVAPFPCVFDLLGEQSSAVMKSAYWLGLVSCWVCDVDEMAFILNADPKVKIVVVTHSLGIDFLISGAKDSKGREFSGTVSGLAGRGVEFRVCNNTLVSRKIDPGTLLMETKIVPSGVAEVAMLQAKEGYVYIKP